MASRYIFSQIGSHINLKFNDSQFVAHIQRHRQRLTFFKGFSGNNIIISEGDIQQYTEYIIWRHFYVKRFIHARYYGRMVYRNRFILFTDLTI